MDRWKRSWPDLSEDMPFDVMPVSNGEFIPPPPTDFQRNVMALQNQAAEEVRHKMGMSRREFVRTSAAISIGLWAMREVASGRAAGANHRAAACDLHNPAAQMNNFPGEFIFDVQTHHVDEEGLWRVTNPGFHAFFLGIWPQSRCGELNGVPTTECLGRYHYIKEVYLDSSTNMGVLSAVPSSPDRNPLPTQEAIETVLTINEIAKSQRAVMHSFVMPNRGHGWATEQAAMDPAFLQDELDNMTALSELGVVRAWKCYTPWGDVPNASGWFHDGLAGRKMIEHALAIGVPVIATHKGFALPSFDQRSASPRDIGVVAHDYWDPTDDAKTIKMIVYHSGYDSELQAAYPGDTGVNSADRGVNQLIKSLRENGMSARNFAPGGTPRVPFADGNPAVHANSPNVYAEIGSTWRSVVTTSNNSQSQMAHLLGKLIYYVGPRRVVWGTDSLWYGSPQTMIARLREFPRPDETVARDILATQYHLPWGLDGDVDDPSINVNDNVNHPGTYNPARSIRNGIFGRNAAVPYGIDPDAARNAISCDALQDLRDSGYVENAGTEFETRPLSSNVVYGARTRRELFANIWPNAPWAP